MKKILLTILFLVAIFGYKVVFADDASATSITGVLDNRNGSVSAVVTLNCYKSGGTFFQSVNYTITAGNTTDALCSETGDNPNYSIDWTTSCDVGSASAPFVGPNYVFANQDVHCTTPNALVSVTGTSCTGSTGRVDWKVSGTNINIDKFKVYKSLGTSSNPDSDTSPIEVDYVSPTTPYGTDITGSTIGTWNVKVYAYANPPDGGNSVYATGSYICGGGIAPPSGLQVNVTCVGLQAKVDFSWVAATGATFSYVVETSTAVGDPGSSGSWTGPSATPSPTSNTFVSTKGTYNLATTYWWHVRATSVSPAETYFSSSSSFTTPSTCSSFQAAVLGELTTCLSNQANAAYLTWTRGTPTNQISSEVIQVSTSQNFLPLTSIKITSAVDGVSSSNLDITTLVDSDYNASNTTYWVRHTTTFTGGAQKHSEVKPFAAPTYCMQSGLGDAPRMWSIGYCIGGIPALRLQWYSNNNITSDGYRLYRTSTGLPSGLNGGYHESPPPEFTSYSASIKSLELFGQAADTFHIYKKRPQSGVYVLNAPVNPQTYSPSCGTPPAAPGNLQIPGLTGVNCSGPGGTPAVLFSFRDKSTTEERFILDVSTDPNFPVGGYGTKTITAPSPSGTGDTVTFEPQGTGRWSSGNPLDSGDANPQDSIDANNLIPMDAAKYYWRVRANNTANGDSINKYPDGTTFSTIYPSGVPFDVLYAGAPCRPRHDLSAKILDGSWRTRPGGCNYTQVPTVNFSGGEGTGAAGTAVLSVGYVYVTAGGTGYASAPDVNFNFSGGSPTDPASGSAIIVGDTVVGVNLVSAGSGYTGVPTISFSGGGGSGASAFANMTVTSVTMNSGGEGYTSPPTVTFSDGGTNISQASATAKIHSATGRVSDVDIVAPAQTQSFKAATCASLDIQVTNEGGPYGTPSNANDNMLYFYYKGPVTANCPGTKAGQAPNDGYPHTHFHRPRYTIPALSPGQSYIARVNFDVGTTAGAFTGYGYVVPNCGDEFSDLGTDPNWTNNLTGGFSYKIGVDQFFQTTGGDIGAKDSISVGVSGYDQGDYLVAATDINKSVAVSSLSDMTVDQYSKSLVAGGGVHKYFADRLKSKAMANDTGGIGCNIGSGSYNLGNKLYYCSGDVTINSETQISGNPVFFINGNLNINDRVYEGGPNHTIVFVVNGDINVASSVIQLDGIYIARKSFSDGGTVAAPADRLTLSGSIWVDGESGGNMNLSRSFSLANDNATNPTIVINYNPKYVMLLNSILGFSSVGWGEVSP